MRRSFRKRRSTGPRRKTAWHMAFGASNGNPVNFNTRTLLSHWAIWPVGTWDDSLQSYPGELVANPTDLTLVRSLSNFAVWVESPNQLDPPVDADSMYTIGYGLIKFSHPTPAEIDSDVFLSGDQIPGPLTNPTMDWIWRGLAIGRTFGAVSVSGPVDTDFAKTQSRAMRKLSQNEGVLQVFEFILWNDLNLSDPANFRNISYYFESRMLVKEA